MVSRSFAFDHGGFARRSETAKKYRGFHLRRGHRGFVLNRNRIARAPQPHRQPGAVGLFENVGADAHVRFKHAPHRTAAQACVTIEDDFDRMTGGHPHGEPDAGAGIAEIDDAGRLEQGPDADTGDTPRAGVLAFDGSAELFAGARRRQHVVAFQ